MKHLCAFAVFLISALPSFGQQGYYGAIHQATLAAAADTVTVQAPATKPNGSRNVSVQFQAAVVSCSVACTITVSQNGTPATTTSLAINSYNLSPAPTSVAFSASNVGAGTTIGVYTLSAGSPYTINLSAYTMSPGGNLSVGTNAISGNSVIQLYFTEQ